MAKFIEVMEQAKRMCKAFGDGHCSECPIGHANALECEITVTSGMDCEEVERRVMQWAAEHPEPVYPTWREWQNSTFKDAHTSIRPCNLEAGIGLTAIRKRAMTVKGNLYQQTSPRSLGLSQRRRNDDERSDKP